MNTLHLARAVLSAIVAAVAVAALMPAANSGRAMAPAAGGLTAYAAADRWSGFADTRPLLRHPQHPAAIRLSLVRDVVLQ